MGEKNKRFMLLLTKQNVSIFKLSNQLKHMFVTVYKMRLVYKSNWTCQHCG